MNRQTIFCCGFPKSGTTYLTRLLGDVLNSPTGGCMPSEDSKEVATEGQDRPGSYIVRKGHFVLIDDDTGPVVPSPHRLAWKQLTNEKIVFLVRDPRDICVSGAWHWRTGPADFLDRMIKGDVAKCGRWDEYYKGWFTVVARMGVTLRHLPRIFNGRMRYEDINRVSISNLLHLDLFIPYEDDIFWPGRINDALERQSFSSRKAQIGDDPKELRRNNMRKGVVGDWRNHFTPEMNDKIWNEFGWMMERLGYE